MKKLIKKILKAFLKVLPLKKILLFILPIKKIIIFESAPDLSDNTKAVFDEMIKRGINKKYKLFWFLSKPPASPYPKIKNVKYLYNNNFRLSIYKLIVRLSAKCFICCNAWLGNSRPGQTSIYLSHGTTIKSLKGYYVMPPNIDYCLSAAEDVNFLCEKELGAATEKIIALGFPRNDILTNADADLKAIWKDKDFEKVIVWYPTYRQHKNGKTVSAGSSLPIIHDSEQAKILNETARKNKILIVLKPHFAQDLSYIKNMQLSNIIFIDDSFFAENNITSYEFVGSCDALITDYSSIYYDFTLCDKPIALIWEDYEEYKESIGFADGVEEFLAGGEKVYTIEEFKSFVENVANGIDNLKNQRNEVCRKVNYSKDGKNAQRVTDFIMQTIEKHKA